jgi:putative hemolysin
VTFAFGDLLVIVVLTFLEGFFVASEIALVSVRRSRIEQLIEEGVGGARRVRRLQDDPGKFLAVAQLGLTVIGFFASAFAAVSLSDSLAGLFASVGVEPTTAETMALIVVTLVLALFTIVFAELIPKTLALANAERFAIALAPPIDFLARVLGPVIALLTGITRLVTGGVGAKVSAEAQISAEELRLIVERGGEQGVLEAEEEQMINAVIELGDRRLHEVMTPRIAIVALSATASFGDAIDIFVDAGHSRIPVYETSVDDIVGILYAKDLLPFLKSGDDRPALRSLLRTPVFVPESMTIDDLLHEFQRRKVHIAIVLDEYGGTAGLLTIEDLLEEIVGEILDEYDVEEPLLVRLSEEEARVDGRAAVDDLLDLFDLENVQLEDEDEYDTVGGLVYHRVGGVPSPGDEIHVDGLRLTVESTDGRRVGKVLVVREHQEGGPLPDGDEER